MTIQKRSPETGSGTQGTTDEPPAPDPVRRRATNPGQILRPGPGLGGGTAGPGDAPRALAAKWGAYLEEFEWDHFGLCHVELRGAVCDGLWGPQPDALPSGAAP